MLNYINPQDIEFYISNGKLLCLKLNGEDIGRVSVKRMFPFQFSEEYISICPENHLRSDSEKEIGIIRNINDLPKIQKDLLIEELSKRYFIPNITEVKKIKEEFGNISFEVITDAGKREFTITDMGSNIKSLGNDKVMLTDVYGNRFYIPDVKVLNDKGLKLLEIWL